jgi:putative hydrolase of the HAD superfamily
MAPGLPQDRPSIAHRIAFRGGPASASPQNALARIKLVRRGRIRYKRRMHDVTATTISARRTFDQVETWVFDLDNTLYSYHLNLWQQVDARIRDYVATFLRVSAEEAFRIQKDYYKRYGTTMRGLMTEHGLNPDDFLAFVHEIDHSPLQPDQALDAAIARLPGRKLVLTNGTCKHARAVMSRLAIDHHFEDVFDIVAANLEPKPAPQTYDRFLARHGVDPARAAMFEDLARNLTVPHALGMTTVLIVPQSAPAVAREDWELLGREAPHVDHVTDDLAGFLTGIRPVL